jgi:Xaa-Pro aminopeptidase
MTLLSDTYSPPRFWLHGLPNGLNKLRRSELLEKRERVGALLDDLRLDGIWLVRLNNFAWMTGYTTPHFGERRWKGLLITREVMQLVVTRAEDYEFFQPFVSELGLELCLLPDESSSRPPASLVGSGAIGTDVLFPDHVFIDRFFAHLRLTLTATEQYRYRILCRDSASILYLVAHSMRSQQTEQEVANDILHSCQHIGIMPEVLMVSADQGIRRYRQSLPQGNRVQRFALLMLSASRGGLHAALTRMVALDSLPATIEAQYLAATYLSSVGLSVTQPGHALDDTIRAGMQVAKNYPRDWRARFQVDVLDYGPRELRPAQAAHSLERYQAVAWSAAVNGIRSEDTVLVLPDHGEVLTNTEEWPVFEVQVQGDIYHRPDILRL